MVESSWSYAALPEGGLRDEAANPPYGLFLYSFGRMTRASTRESSDFKIRREAGMDVSISKRGVMRLVAEGFKVEGTPAAGQFAA